MAVADSSVAGRRWWPSGRLLPGPSLVFVLASFGPQHVLSNAVVGAEHGYSLLWTAVALAMARYVVLEASGRYVAVTGDSLIEGYARCGRWVAWLLLISIFVKRHLTNLTHILLMGAAAALLAPNHGPYTAGLYSMLLWALGFGLMWWGRYPRIERCFRPLALLLACCLIAVGLLARPDPGSILRGLLVPSISGGGSFSNTLFLLMALLGSGAGSVNNLKYPAFLIEKWSRPDDRLRSNRREALRSAVGLFFAALLVQVAVAAAAPGEQGLKTIADLAAVTTRVLSKAGRIAVCLGLAASAFSTFVGANAGYSLIASDIFHNVLYRRISVNGSQTRPTPGDLPAYRWALFLFAVPPLYVLGTNWQPVWLVLSSAAVMVVLLPLTVTVLLVLTNDRKRMGDHVNGWMEKTVMMLVVAASLYLTFRSVTSLFSVSD